MTPDACAAIYAAAFPAARPWSAGEITDLTNAHGGFRVESADGFALGRAIAGEAELVTIAVHPDAQGQGQGRALLAAFDAAARERAAAEAFLEVAFDNAAARALYARTGWVEAGRRRGYYPRVGAAPVDALLFTKKLA